MIDSFYQNPIANIIINHEMLRPFPLKNRADFLLNLMCSEIDHALPSTPTALGQAAPAQCIYYKDVFKHLFLSRVTSLR